ncbi:MAG TPA: YiaA/YiaB family inner membrane protein, partial [Ottowia sp.]|nr:YiaA/YiaB family inner membrane protein [Ottowia sp.]
MSPQIGRPSNAFVAASWAALCIGSVVYLIGLWNAQMQLNEKGYYLTLLAYGLFSAISLQKSVRDRAEGIPVTGMYYNLCWFSVALVLLLLTIGLWNAKLADSEAPLARALDAASPGQESPAVQYDEAAFRYALNDDAMGTEKLAE